MIGDDIRRETTVDTDQKFQEKVEAAANMVFQPKQRYQINQVHDYMAVPSLCEFLYVSSYPLLESMGFDTDISDGVVKMRAATLLGKILRLHQHTKNWLKYAHKNSNYRHLVAITASITRNRFQELQETKSGLKNSSPFVSLRGGR